MMFFQRTILACLVLAMFGVAACGNGDDNGGNPTPTPTAEPLALDFAPAVSLDAGNVPSKAQALFVGNMTADQNLDIAVLNSTIGVFVGDGNGGFGPVINATSTISNPTALAAGDYPDANIDLVAAFPAQNQIDIFFDPNQDGNYAAPGPYAGGTAPEGLAIADFDKDGEVDDIATVTGTNSLFVKINTGTPAFTNTDYPSGGTLNNPKNVVAADFNNDGNIDVAISNGGSDFVTVWLNTGTVGNLFPAANASATLQMPAGSNQQGITTADLDEDGLPDLIVPSPGTAQVAVFMNAGGGTFDAASLFATSNDPFGAATGDFNQDGNLDIVVANAFDENFQDGEIGVYLGNGSGGFAAAVPFAAGQNSAAVNNNPRAVAVGDFNNDGLPDVVTANNQGSSISIFLNTSN